MRPRRPAKPTRRRVLELLAAAPDGLTEALLRARAVPLELVAEFAHARLATATSERVLADGHAIEIVRGRIIKAGRQTLVRRSL